MTQSEIDAAIGAAIGTVGANVLSQGQMPSFHAIWNAACEACAKACDELPSSEPEEWGADAYEMMGIERAVEVCRALKSPDKAGT